jgi:hypothetical protein
MEFGQLVDGQMVNCEMVDGQMVNGQVVDGTVALLLSRKTQGRLSHVMACPYRFDSRL